MGVKQALGLWGLQLSGEPVQEDRSWGRATPVGVGVGRQLWKTLRWKIEGEDFWQLRGESLGEGLASGGRS